MSSKDYWNKRETEALKHYITDEEEYSKRIKAIYEDMYDNIQAEIDGFFGRYASKEGISIAEAKKRVSRLDIEAYERKAKRIVKDKDFSKQANEEMRLYNLTMKVNRLELLKANIGLYLVDGHNELETYMQEILQGRTLEELERQAGILGKSVLNNEKMAAAIVNASFYHATFSDRVWMYQDLMKADLAKLLQSGLIQGKNPRVLARELKKKFGVSTANAERLMRTELARVQTEAQKQSFERNGFELYTFIANADCCPICARLDGKHFKVKDMFPGENAAPMHPHCRCSTAAYEDSATYEAWLNYLNKGGTTEEWNASGKAIWKSKNRQKKKPERIEKSGKSDKMKLNLNLQFFASGKERAEKYSENWKAESLQNAIDRFAKGSNGVVNSEKGKIIYTSLDGKYSVVYDYNGDYFRIEDNTKTGKRRYVDIDGNDVSNITISGKTRGRTRDEYERETHFNNSDSK